MFSSGVCRSIDRQLVVWCTCLIIYIGCAMWMGIFFFVYDKQRGESVQKNLICVDYIHMMKLPPQPALLWLEDLQFLIVWLWMQNQRRSKPSKLQTEKQQPHYKRTWMKTANEQNCRLNQIIARSAFSLRVPLENFVSYSTWKKEKNLFVMTIILISRGSHNAKVVLLDYREALNYVLHRKKKFSGGTTVNSANNCIKRWIAGGAAHKRTITHLIKCCVSRQIGCF